MNRITKNKLLIVVVWMLFILMPLSASNTIVLDSFDTQEKAQKTKEFVETLVNDTNCSLGRMHLQENIKLFVEQKNDAYILKVDHFNDSNSAALAYLALKEYFPNEFILSDTMHTKTKVVYKEVEVEKDNLLSWVAIFSLALIGVLALFVSSKHIRKINKSNEKLQSKQREIELFFTHMGENIFELSKQIVDEERLHTKPSKEDTNTKNRLFDESRKMIFFLKLKSKKIEVSREKFNINTMLSNILGTIYSNFQESKTELIFDIDKMVPKEIATDLIHLSEILIELLQNALAHTPEGQVKLEITIDPKSSLQFRVSDNGGGISKEKLETLFIPTYTQNNEYKGVGLYVAQELAILLGGELFVEKCDAHGTVMVCRIPLMESIKTERRNYRLPSKEYTHKSVLLFETNIDAANAIKKLFNYFEYNVDIISTKSVLSKIVNLASYDLIIGDILNLDSRDISIIKMIRREKNLKVVNLSSVFSLYKHTKEEHIDQWLKKPLDQERVLDLITILFDQSGGTDSVKAIAKERLENLRVYNPDMAEKKDNFATSDFADFRGKRFLIVDDNPIDQKLFKSIFQKSDIRVTLADNGEDALAKLKVKGASFDIVLMDISMPIMDGYLTIQEIRKDKDFDSLPIIATTAMSLESHISKIFQLGCNAYVGKPINLSYLHSVLAFFLTAKTKTENTNRTTQESSRKVLEHIDGLDFKRGIKQANNSEELYLQLLKEFLAAYGDSANTIKRMVDEDRYQQAKRLCLDMKGVTASIGAYEMFDIVDSMYKQYIYNNQHLIPKFVETYTDGMNKLLQAIEKYRAVHDEKL